MGTDAIDIPLPLVDGASVQLTFPVRPLTERAWANLMDVLCAMKPGLVELDRSEDDLSTEPAESAPQTESA